MAGHVGTKGVPRGERERQILELAAEEFGTRGYAHASMVEIAQRAGVSKPLVYNYFGSKDGLYLACLDRAGRNLVDAVAAAQHGVSLARAADTLTAIFTALEPRRHDWAVLYDATLPHGSAVHEAARRHRHALAALGAAGATEVLAAHGGTDPGDQVLLTHVWFNIVTAAVTWWLQHPEESAEHMGLRCRRVAAALLAAAEPVRGG